MASVGAMRCALVEAYPGNERWKKRVEGMPEYRVIAVYNSMQREGRLYRHEKPKTCDYGVPPAPQYFGEIESVGGYKHVKVAK